MKNKVFLTSLKFNDGTDLTISENDIVIFTGANNCGKSQILRDVLGILNEGSTPNNIVVRSLMQNRLGDANALSNNFVYKNNKYCCGCVGLSRLDLVGIYWRDASKLGQLTRLFVNHLSTENRLADSHTSGQYDSINGTPSNPTQIMYNNDAMAKKSQTFFTKHLISI
ncbi:MAG: ABC transporter ATP-binding protein [Rikenellaceae bacterium]